MIPKTMRACLLTAPNKFETREVPVPKAEAGEVLCRIRAAAICGTDPEIVSGTHLSRGWPPRYPFILGHEWSGEVAEAGPGVIGFQVGDRVAGEAHKGCGFCRNCVKGNYTLCLNYGNTETGHRHYGFTVPGANCEYNAYSIKSLQKIPDNLSFPHASLVDTAGVALHGVKLIGVTPGGAVLIYGPGPIGLCALQIARGMGAGKTIMVGRGRRLEAAKEIGADFTIDFAKEDPVKKVGEITGGAGADEVLECSGAAAAPAQCIHSVRNGGGISLLGFYEDAKLAGLPLTKVALGEIMIRGSRANPNVSEEVIRLFEKGILNGEKIVTHRFPLEKYEEAFQTFINRRDGAIKVVVEP